MIAAWCFQCGLDYSAEVAECVECGVPTVGHPPTPLHSVGADDDAHIAYELHGWNGRARAAVENGLHRAHIVHAWSGPTLTVREVDEDAVDAIIGEVDDSMATSATEGQATEGGMVGFDLGARNEALHNAVRAKLAEEGLEHELMGNGFLLVPSSEEDRVGDWIEAIQAEMRGTETFGQGVAGIDSHTVVEAIFLAADTLRRNPRDARAQHQLRENAALARDLKLPFGYEATMWRAVLDQADVLSALVEDAAEDAMVVTEARELRAILQNYV